MMTKGESTTKIVTFYLITPGAGVFRAELWSYSDHAIFPLFLST